jgi:hypothetical protein
VGVATPPLDEDASNRDGDSDAADAAEESEESDDRDAGREGKWGPVRVRVEELIAQFYEARPYFYSKYTEGYMDGKKKLQEQKQLAQELNGIPSNVRGKAWTGKFLFSQFSKFFSQLLQ